MGSSSNILSEPFAPNDKMTLWNKILAGLYEYFTAHMYDEALVRQTFTLFLSLDTANGADSG